MKIFLTLSFLILLNKFCFSQKTSIVVIEKDTFGLVPVQSLERANECIENLQHEKVLLNSQKRISDTYKKLSDAKSTRIEIMKREISAHDSLEINLNKIIDIKTEYSDQMYKKDKWHKLLAYIFCSTTILMSGMYLAK